MQERAWIAEERAIARRHLGRFPWGSLIWAVLNFAVWLSLWPLVLTGLLPLWAGFLIACANVALCYLPSHEAQHDIYARPGERLRWLNETVGTLSVLPLATPFRMLRITHLEHHKHTNDLERDPDYDMHARSPLAAIHASIRARGPKGQEVRYRAVAEAQGRDDLVMEAAAYALVYYGLLSALAWSGLALEAALLLWLPRHVGGTYILFYLSWAPHNPGLAKGRYRDTRAFRSWGGNLSALGMEAHIVHHLHPRIPLLRTPRAYREMRHILDARECRLDGC